TLTANLAVSPVTIDGTAVGLITAYPPVLRPTRFLRHWNHIAIDASGLDHTPGGGHQQLGPCRAARAEAIVHVAIFEAVNAIIHRYHSYVGLAPVAINTSTEAAIAQAARDTLVALFSAQAANCDAELTHDLNEIPDSAAKTQGIAVGHAAAVAILQMRNNDG